MREGSFDAAFLAVGAHIAKRAYIPAGEAAHVLDAVSMLREHGGDRVPLLGRRVVVYGGGDTAMDAAQDGQRLGASDAIVVYRRTRERMPAHDVEVQEALEEGVVMKWLSTVKHADADGLVIERMELDETGFPQPTGEVEEPRGRLARARARPGGRPVAARRRARPGGRGRGREGRAEHDDRLSRGSSRVATWCRPSAR